MVKGCALSTGYLPRGGLPRNSVDRITEHPDMTSAVDRGRKASTQTQSYVKSQECDTSVKQRYNSKLHQKKINFFAYAKIKMQIPYS